ncbi:hypothetical protein QL996_11715 [Planococcus sp. APC 4015]|nr:hypothetical protein [Planococcus sp. APC 4015]
MLRRTRPLIALAAMLLALSSCATSAPEGATPMTTPAPSLTAEPSVTVMPEPTEPADTTAVPTDCSAVNSQGILDQLNLQGDGTGFIRPAPTGATPALGCDWFAGDATGYLLLISTTEASTADAYIATLPAEGWTCGARGDGGRMCTMTTPNPQYPVDTVETVFTQGDVWIYQSASNIDGDALLSNLITSIWQA